ncbi:MAG TPA: LamG-like jellyroll fold domain-containing protein [Verrucomicrobiae bacterium]|jgi:hypothetical protein
MKLVWTILLFCFLARQIVCGQTLPGGGGDTNYNNAPLQTWSFANPVNWTNDAGYPPISFANLSHSYLGNGQSMVLDTNVPAWLNYNVIETNGTKNLTVNTGSIAFWFAPDWSSTNLGGFGPQEWGRLFEAGAYTTNSNYGWWSLYVDSGGNNLYFSAQTNDDSGNYTTYLSAPISWKTNYFHFIALTYSSTNTSLYIDGGLVTNGAAMTVWPGTNVLANGFYLGSDNSGTFQGHGMFNDLATYNYTLNGDTVGTIYNNDWIDYVLNPLNAPYMSPIQSAPSEPSYTNDTFDAISGHGNLIFSGYASSCYDGTNSYNVWLTNVTTSVEGNGTINATFTIEGGAPGIPFDVFANSALSFGTNGVPWAWMGQGYQCQTYMLTNLPANANCFLILGTPQDTSGFGLTDAYELLVAKMNPDGPQTDSYGVPYAWYAQNGLSMQSATQDPDQDGLLNYQEYEYGSKPTVSEGFGIWVSDPGGTTSIP